MSNDISINEENKRLREALDEAQRALRSLRGGNHYCAPHHQVEVFPNADGFHATPERWDELLASAEAHPLNDVYLVQKQPRPATKE